MTDEIDIIVLHVWVNDLGKAYIALEDYYATACLIQSPSCRLAGPREGSVSIGSELASGRKSEAHSATSKLEPE